MIELKKWDRSMENDLIDICNKVDRTFLSERMPNPYTHEAADWWLGMVEKDEGKEGVFRAIVVDGIVAGNITVERNSDVYRKSGDIGYFLIEEFKGKGIMSEATGVICRLAFEELDIERITGLVYAPNAASQRVLEKNGFEKEGLMRKAVYKGGQYWDQIVYGKLK